MGFGIWFMNKRNAFIYSVHNLESRAKKWDKKINCKCNRYSCNLHANIISHLCHINLVYLLAKLIIL